MARVDARKGHRLTQARQVSGVQPAGRRGEAFGELDRWGQKLRGDHRPGHGGQLQHRHLPLGTLCDGGESQLRIRDGGVPDDELWDAHGTPRTQEDRGVGRDGEGGCRNGLDEEAVHQDAPLGLSGIVPHAQLTPLSQEGNVPRDAVRHSIQGAPIGQQGCGWYGTSTREENGNANRR